MKKTSICWIIIVALLILITVSAFATELILVEKIIIDQETIIIPVGKTINVKASIEPRNATVKTLEWISADESVATVKNGSIKGVSCGETIVTATAADESGNSTKIKVTVVQPVKKIIIEDNKITLAPGVCHQMKTTVEPMDASIPDVTWASSNEKVAIVDSTGVVTGISKGNAKITAIAADGSGVKTSVTIKVDEFHLVFTSKRPQNVMYSISGTGNYKISGSVKNGNVSIPKIDDKGWRSSGYSTETVEVTPLHPGVDVVTVKFNNKKLNYDIFVADYFEDYEIQYVPVPDTSPKESNGSFRDIVYGTPYSEVKDQLIETYGKDYTINDYDTGLSIRFKNPEISVAGHKVELLEFDFCYDEGLDGYIKKDEASSCFFEAHYYFDSGEDDPWYIDENNPVAKNLYSKLCDLYGDPHYEFEDASSHDWHDNDTYITLYHSTDISIFYLWGPGWSKSSTLESINDYLSNLEIQKKEKEEQDLFGSTTDGL